MVSDFLPAELDVLGWHVTMRLRIERPLALTPAEFRWASRAILRQGATRGLLVHRVVDTHLHAVLACSREHAGFFAKTAGSSLKQGLGLPSPFEPARFTPILDLRHLRVAVLYVLRQTERHGANVDRAHDGSALPDLLGLRCVDATPRERLASLLPRMSSTDLLPILGVPDLVSAPLDAAHLADGAAAALGLADLHGNRPERAVARHAAVTATEGQLETTAIMDALSLSRRRINALRREPAPAPLVRAVQLQVRLRTALDACLDSRLEPQVDHQPGWTPTFGSPSGRSRRFHALPNTSSPSFDGVDAAPMD